MSVSLKIACLGLFLASSVLSGCGFQPLVGTRTGDPVSNDLAGIRILTIADRSGQILRNYLLSDLTPRENIVPAVHSLEVKLQEPRQEIAIRRDESASRVGYTANATFILRDSSGRAVFSGSSVSSSSYETTNSEFSSIAGQRNARDRAMQEISADIRQQLAAYFVRMKAAQ